MSLSQRERKPRIVMETDRFRAIQLSVDSPALVFEQRTLDFMGAISWTQVELNPKLVSDLLIHGIRPEMPKT